MVQNNNENSRKLRVSRDLKSYTPEQLARIDEEGNKFCGADTNKGTQCLRPRGFRTNHPGEGRCHFHEGVGNGTIVKPFEIPAIEERMEKYISDKDIYSLDREIALLRAYLELYSDMIAAFEALDEFDMPGRNEEFKGFSFDLPQLNQALNSTTRTLAKLIETKHNIEVGRKYVIDVKHVSVMMGIVANIIDTTVEDLETRTSINKKLNSIILSPMGA
jgi:hypothetical protein